MVSTDDILTLLYQRRDEYSIKLAEINLAISALEGKQIISSTQPIKTNNSEHKPYPTDRLEQIIKQPYSFEWTYSDQIMWLLVKFGGMTPKDMGDKVMEFMPEMTAEDNKTLQTRLGYRAKEMVNMGQLEYRKQGYFNYYWVFTPELLALNENQ